MPQVSWTNAESQGDPNLVQKFWNIVVDFLFCAAACGVYAAVQNNFPNDHSTDRAYWPVVIFAFFQISMITFRAFQDDFLDICSTLPHIVAKLIFSGLMWMMSANCCVIFFLQTPSACPDEWVICYETASNLALLMFVCLLTYLGSTLWARTLVNIE